MPGAPGPPGDAADRDPSCTVGPGGGNVPAVLTSLMPPSAVSRRNRLCPAGALRRVAVVLALVTLATVACSGGDGSPVTDPVDGAAGAPGGGQAGPFDDAEVRAFYDRFNRVADDHRVPPNASVGQAGSGLAEIAEPAVVAYYDHWRAQNEQYAPDSPLRMAWFRSYPNISSITANGDTVTIADCTLEVRERNGGQELEAYVTRQLTVARRGDDFRATALDVRHEGRIDSPGYSCIPEAMAAKATDVARAVAEGWVAAQADPARGVTRALDTVVTDPLQQEMAGSLAEQADRKVAITSPTQVTLRVLGLDPRGAGVEVAVVTACIAYPEGLDLRELPSQKVVRQVFPPGTVNKLDYAVRLDHAEGPAAYDVVREERAPSC